MRANRKKVPDDADIRSFTKMTSEDSCTAFGHFVLDIAQPIAIVAFLIGLATWNVWLMRVLIVWMGLYIAASWWERWQKKGTR